MSKGSFNVDHSIISFSAKNSNHNPLLSSEEEKNSINLDLITIEKGTSTYSV
jgi:hypothetical protein